MVDETEFDIMDADHEERLSERTFDCPQCGDECDELIEGYCGLCAVENQQQLDRHNAEYDHWNRMDNDRREEAIRRGYN